MQIFSVSNYEDNLSDSELSSFVRAAAALNLTAAVFGVAVIIVTLCICMAYPDEEKRRCCSKASGCAFISLAVLLVSCLVAALLTIFYGFFIATYSEEGGYSENSSRGVWASIFSGGAAGALICGMCIGGAAICYTEKDEKSHPTVLLVVPCIWALLTGGTVVAGGLMIRVGQSFSSDEVLNSDLLLNRESISSMGYLIGALNFVTTLVAVVVCCFVGVVWVVRDGVWRRCVAVQGTPCAVLKKVEAEVEVEVEVEIKVVGVVDAKT